MIERPTPEFSRAELLRAESSRSRFLRYLRDCWQADGRVGGVLDLFARKVEHLSFLDEPESIFTGELNPCPVERAVFKEAMTTSLIYRREKSLLYGALLLVGKPAMLPGDTEGSKSPFPSRWPRVVCAPLVTASAQLTEEPGYPESLLQLAVESVESSFNFPALTALLGDEETAAQAVQGLLEALPEPPWSSGSIARLPELLAEALPGCDSMALESFPQLVSETEIRREVRAARQRPRGSAGVRVVPAAAVALVPNSPDTRGVLYELSAMAAEEEESRPLRWLLGGGPDEGASRSGVSGSRSPASSDPATIPAVLSNAQHKVVASARRHALTVMVGPPGTGKSYTLAAVALEHLSRGERVLVAARTQQALDVVAEKIELLMGDSSILPRGGRREHLKQLKDHLRLQLRGGLGLDPAGGRSLAALRRGLARTERRIAGIEARLHRRAELELLWGETQIGRSPGWRGVLETARSRFLEWRLGRLHPPWDLTEQYEILLEDRRRRASELLRTTIHRRLSASLQRNRHHMKTFLSALTARRSSEQDLRFGKLDLDVVLSSFPLWLTSFHAVHRVLPRVAELFDLVIVDEATQCDAASVLPVSLRGQRLLVTGDPKQLRHLSFLSGDRQRALAERQGLTTEERERLDYRERSLLDLALEVAEDHDQVAFLDEHFRSTPQIIGFSNRSFYQGSLRVMTRRPDTVETTSLRLVPVEGRREAEGHNPLEAQHLVDELARRVENERRLPARQVSSLGILSPFRDQTDHLGELVRKTLGAGALERHRVQVGTPWAFQGEERDVMLMSLALDDESPVGAFRYLERPDVFNVAITRARSLQLVFCSFDPDRAPVGELLSRYLDYVQEPPSARPGEPDPAGDRFLAEVQHALEDRGFRTWPAYPVAGLILDLMVERGGRALAIDLIGYPGAYAGALDLERCRILRRAGLELFPLPFSSWQRGSRRCIEALERRLTKGRFP